MFLPVPLIPLIPLQVGQSLEQVLPVMPSEPVSAEAVSAFVSAWQGLTCTALALA